MEFLEFMISAPSLGAALLVAGLNLSRIIMVHNKNNIKEKPENYVSKDNFEVLKKTENFVRSYETKVKVTTNDNK